MMRHSLLAATALACLLHGTASAQLAACAPDVEMHCKGTPPGGGRLLKCLQSNKDALTPGCKAAIGVPAGPPSAADACRGDAMKLCKSAGQDRAKVKACLVEHAAQLSDGCKTAMIQSGAAGK